MVASPDTVPVPLFEFGSALPLKFRQMTDDEVWEAVASCEFLQVETTVLGELPPVIDGRKETGSKCQTHSVSSIF